MSAVHALASLHCRKFESHDPVAGLHAYVTHSLLSGHVRGVNWHASPVHMSIVQRFPSSQNGVVVCWFSKPLVVVPPVALSERQAMREATGKRCGRQERPPKGLAIAHKNGGRRKEKREEKKKQKTKKE